MTDYTPAHVGTVTRYVVVESFEITPADLATRAYESGKGSNDQGDLFWPCHHGKRRGGQPDYSRSKEDGPGHIFVKDRGFPPGDARRCRANLGGARPGLPRHGVRDDRSSPISPTGLKSSRNRDAATVPAPENPLEHPAWTYTPLKKLIDAQES